MPAHRAAFAPEAVTVCVTSAVLAPAPAAPAAAETPVFVDDSGTRKRLLRIAGVLLGLLAIGFLGLVGIALATPSVATSVGLGDATPFVVPGAAASPPAKAPAAPVQAAKPKPKAKPRPVQVAASEPVAVAPSPHPATTSRSPPRPTTTPSPTTASSATTATLRATRPARPVTRQARPVRASRTLSRLRSTPPRSRPPPSMPAPQPSSHPLPRRTCRAVSGACAPVGSGPATAPRASGAWGSGRGGRRAPADSRWPRTRSGRW